MEESVSYVLPFEANGTWTSEEEDFVPPSFSTPTAAARLCGFSKIHYDEHSEISHRIKTNTPIQRPMAGRCKKNRIWDTDDGSSLELLDRFDFERVFGVPEGWEDEPFWLLKYKDDILGGERLCNLNAQCHMTIHKEKKMIHAQDSEHFLALTRQNAERIGMRINESKTKMLCINVARNSQANTFIRLADDIFFPILLTHEGSHREVYRDFQPSLTSSAGGAKG